MWKEMVWVSIRGNNVSKYFPYIKSNETVNDMSENFLNNN